MGVHVVTLTVTDDDGATDSDTVTITVNAATPDNQPPTANAGNDQTVTDSDNSGAELVTLDASASADTDGTIVAYQWNADSGVAIADGVSPQVDFPVGVHVVTLTVTDDDGASDSDTVTITVNAATPDNQPPTANAGNDQTVIDSDNSGAELVTLDASASADTDGTIVAYQWNADSGVAIADGVSPQVDFPVGVHVVTLTVTDDDGASDSDTVTITVNPAEPTGETIHINFQPAGSPVPAGYLVDDGSAFGDRGNGYSYGWDARNFQARDQGVDPDQRFDTSNHFEKYAPRVWEIALPNGAYQLHIVAGDPRHANQVNTLDVEGVLLLDPDGQDHFDEFLITVTVSDGRLTVRPGAGSLNAKIAFIDITGGGAPANQPPSANAGNDQTVTDGDNSGAELVTLDASASADTDGTIVSYQWNADSGVAIADGISTQVDFPVGVHVVTLTVTDDDGDDRLRYRHHHRQRRHAGQPAAHGQRRQRPDRHRQRQLRR